MSRSHPQLQRATMMTCPLLFWQFVTLYLGIPDPKHRLCDQLWRRLYATPTLLFRIAQVHDTNARPDTIKAFGEAMPPKELMAACERVAQAQGRTRQLIALEDSLLEHMTADNAWV